jgi:hypothetical protein
MISKRYRLSGLSGLLLWLLCLLSSAGVAHAVDAGETIGGLPPAEALRLGERMYREGLLPSGEPMQAIVQGDIPVDGTMFSCESCHLKSGMGSVEGRVVTLPTNATELFKPFTFSAEETIPPWQSMPDTINWSIRRPAYTDETLAVALAAGFDPAGRELLLTMPRYLLEDDDMAVLIFYLKNLSAQPSPGVTATTIRFATVIGEDIPKQDREAMIKVLQANVDFHNGQMRRQEDRVTKVPFYWKKKTIAYRRFALDIWELHGPPETWRQQLEEYNRQQPVFALVGGLVTGEWRPIHEFCELNRIPSVFPLTEFPVISDSDWYTLYFSKGYYQEGEAAARFLRGHGETPKNVSVVQVYRDTPEGRALARGFAETRKLLGQSQPQNVIFSGAQVPDAKFWKALASRHPSAVMMLWLPAEDLVNLQAWAVGSSHPGRLFLSYGLLGEDLYALPDMLRPFAYITYPYLLPQNGAKRATVIQTWLKFRKIPLTNFSIQAKMYAAGWMLGNGVKMISSDYYRDYFLDVFDMMNDENYSIALYPLLSFGQGQRYASKGCYVVQLTPGDQPELVPKSDWVIH